MFNSTITSDGNPKDNRQKVIFLVAAAYNEKGFEGADRTAQTLKDDGYTIMTINYKTITGVYVPGLDSLATSGYAYKNDDQDIISIIPIAFTQGYFDFISTKN